MSTLACPVCRRHGWLTADGLAGHLERDHTAAAVAATLAAIVVQPRQARANEPGQCSTGKRRYETERDARVELCGAVVGRNRGRNERRERRIYLCDRCDGWHLTSQPERTTA